MCRLVNVIFLHTKYGHLHSVHFENRKEIHCYFSAFINIAVYFLMDAEKICP